MNNVVVQGLGFVGLAMSVAIASAKDENNLPLYNVIGLELDNEQGIKKVSDINSNIFPLKSTDLLLENSFKQCLSRKNLSATTNPEVMANADFIIVDINLDVDLDKERGSIDFKGFIKAIKTIGDHVSSDALVIIETTVPPGTTEKIAYPILKEKFDKRFSPETSPMVAHSYERVMPGPDYFNSITNFWRVYSGCNLESTKKCKKFLETIINTKKYEMKEVMSPTASETAKIMENSYRALNIAFIDEWSKFADLVEIDLFDVVSAIKVRPTHNNIMNPGLGVGGYCLTKDPLMGMVALDQIFKKQSEFPLSKLSVEINKQMPKNTFNKIMENLSKKGNKILILGITYREDVADTRFSASEQLIKLLLDKDLEVDCYDPMIKKSTMKGVNLLNELPNANDYSVIVLTVKHKKFLDLNFNDWLLNFSGFVIDSNNIMEIKEIKKLRESGINIKAIGRGNI